MAALMSIKYTAHSNFHLYIKAVVNRFRDISVNPILRSKCSGKVSSLTNPVEPWETLVYACSVQYINAQTWDVSTRANLATQIAPKVETFRTLASA